MTWQRWWWTAAGMLSLLATGVDARGQCDYEWSPLGQGVGVGSSPYGVYALEVYENRLIAAGTFSVAGGSPANNVASWNGATWQPLGDGLGTGPNDQSAHALTVYAGDLIAGGYFTSAGGAPANRVARWNGTDWSALGSGVTNNPTGAPYVETLAVFEGDLIAGGGFETAGGVTARYVARWNGSSWSAMGAGLNRSVFWLHVFQGSLFAGGDFGGRVARWNGADWDIIGTMNAGVDALAEFDDGGGPALYAGGAFTSPQMRMAKWLGGTGWANVGGGIGFTGVQCLRVFDDGSGPALYAGGDFNTAGGGAITDLARWDGAAWSAVGSIGSTESHITEVIALMPFQGGLIAGGTFTTAGGAPASKIARWGRRGAYADMIADATPTSCGPQPCTPAPASNVLGAPDVQVTNFDNVGATPGYVTVKFTGRRVEDVAGTDLIVWVIEQEFFEGFRVLASQDNLTYTVIGTQPGAGCPGFDPCPIEFDLASGGLAWATFIKIENLNITGPGDGCCEGPDLDAVEALCLMTFADCDGDNVPDEVDADKDGDGVANGSDVCPDTPNCNVGSDGRPRLDLNNDCNVDGDDMQLIVNEMLAGCSACP